jgi:PRC-barrel domain
VSCSKLALVLALAGWGVLSGCHSRPVATRSQPATPTFVAPLEAPVSAQLEGENSNAVAVLPGDVQSAVPPCVREVPIAKPQTPKRRAKAMPEQAKTESAQPPAPSRAAGSAEIAVIPFDTSVASVLGKMVEGSSGEDLGRVVDLQADATGRVLLVIIEYGGFLGVGNRRAAVDWSLLHFHPDNPDRPLSLGVSAKKLQSTPDFRQSSHPQALMAPAVVAPSAPLTK